MANLARRDQVNRSVEVNRLELLKTLESNKLKHVKEYEEAMAGYREALSDALNSVYARAKAKLDTAYGDLQVKISEMSEEDIKEQNDYTNLIGSVDVHLEVPRSFEADYDAAIDIAKWEVNDTMELTHAEFTCFVRDQWEWTSDFKMVTRSYGASA